MLYFFNAILVLLELRKWAPVSARVFNRERVIATARLEEHRLGKVIRIRLIRQMAHKTVIRHILETHSGLIRGCSRYPLVIFLKNCVFYVRVCQQC